MCVSYRTEDGTANAGSDYEATEGTVTFRPGESVHPVKISIIDDDIFEEDEYFKVSLFDVRVLAADGSSDPKMNSSRAARLEPPAVATIVILDDDHAGVFGFAESATTVSFGAGRYIVLYCNHLWNCLYFCIINNYSD